MNYSIEANFGGVPNGEVYRIEDTPETAAAWRELHQEFEEVFGAGANSNRKDYKITDWHHGMMHLFVYLYGTRFYVRSFVPAVVGILKAQPQPCFAKFECFDDESRLIGCFMVFDDRVIFDKSSEKSGLVALLMGASEG